jgi:hypothetical protein
MRADNPDMKILVAKIVPMKCPECFLAGGTGPGAPPAISCTLG